MIEWSTNVESADCLSADKLRKWQDERLRATVQHAFQNVPLYRERFQACGVAPESVSGIEDLPRLPFLFKSDYREQSPYGLFATPLEQVVRLHSSSGTTGMPTVVGYTQNDIDLWTSVMERTLRLCGVTPTDVVQVAFGYGLFTGGLGVHYGAESLGATVIPVSGGQSDRQIQLLRDLNVTTICCTPSYFLHLLERADDLGINLRELPLQTGIFGAEPWSEPMRQRIEDAAGIRAYDIYGLSEIIGPGVASACEEQDGLHVFEDHFFPEIVDPDSGESLPVGEEGELVLTTLSREAVPAIRYRTGDITALISDPCPCGRTTTRIRRVTHRCDDMLIVRGVNIYPAQIEDVLLSSECVSPHYEIHLTRDRSLDQIEVRVEIDRDDLGNTDQVCDQLAKRLHQVMGIKATITLAESMTLARSEGKARRVFDRRCEERV